MRKIIEQAVVTLDGQTSTPQDWLPSRWEGEFEQLSRNLLFSVDALLYGRISYENHAEVWPCTTATTQVRPVVARNVVAMPAGRSL